MIRALGNTTMAELIKLRGLPEIRLALIGTVGAAAAFSALVAASGGSDDADPVRAVLETIPFLQVGVIVLGVLVVAGEYTGRQIRTTLVATPRRLVVLAAKTLAYLTASAVASVVAVACGLCSAWVVAAARGDHVVAAAGGRPAAGTLLAGATVYLVLIGLLGLAVAVVARSLIVPLVALLAHMLIVSPLLAGLTEHARWLPDRAGSLLHLPDDDAVLDPATGALVLVAWIAVATCAAGLAFARRDA
ncbi:ABC transporter permease subunit [Myceligenerans halotolerans]